MGWDSVVGFVEFVELIAGFLWDLVFLVLVVAEKFDQGLIVLIALGLYYLARIDERLEKFHKKITGRTRE